MLYNETDLVCFLKTRKTNARIATDNGMVTAHLFLSALTTGYLRSIGLTGTV